MLPGRNHDLDLSRILSAIRVDGVKFTLTAPRWAYNRLIRPRLPITNTEYPLYNGVKVGGSLYPSEAKNHLFDSLVWWETPVRQDEPTYEQGTISALRDVVRSDDSVVIVGGGLGVTAVVSAKIADSGNVTIFEAALDKVANCRNTIQINGVDDRCIVSHALIGKEIHVHGYLGNAELIEPAEIPECDVLELDCEGTEELILEHLTIRPRAMILEVHTPHVEQSKIEPRLDELGYTIRERTDHDGKPLSESELQSIWETEHRPNTYIITAIRD